MAEHLVAIFGSESVADAAARDLENAGIPAAAIRRYRSEGAPNEPLGPMTKAIADKGVLLPPQAVLQHADKIPAALASAVVAPKEACQESSRCRVQRGLSSAVAPLQSGPMAQDHLVRSCRRRCRRCGYEPRRRERRPARCWNSYAGFAHMTAFLVLVRQRRRRRPPF